MADADDPDAALDAREAARVRRRDREASAEERALLKPGMGKVFKQITDSWAKPVSPVRKRARKGPGAGPDRPR